ncbi:MAG TPA: hypothetical protein VLV78_20035 [Thermoanaerobaculia bacterium]|nr:hypothetical protein [Thermoanaerobaculia bacterium]
MWGAIKIPIIDRQRGGAYYVLAIVLGAIAPVLVAWFVVAPIRHHLWRPAGIRNG